MVISKNLCVTNCMVYGYVGLPRKPVRTSSKFNGFSSQLRGTHVSLYEFSNEDRRSLNLFLCGCDSPLTGFCTAQIFLAFSE